jgi:hypothetical protein
MVAAQQAARFSYLPISTPSLMAGALRRSGATSSGTPTFAGASPTVL